MPNFTWHFITTSTLLIICGVPYTFETTHDTLHKVSPFRWIEFTNTVGDATVTTYTGQLQIILTVERAPTAELFFQQMYAGLPPEDQSMIKETVFVREKVQSLLVEGVRGDVPFSAFPVDFPKRLSQHPSNASLLVWQGTFTLQIAENILKEESFVFNDVDPKIKQDCQLLATFALIELETNTPVRITSGSSRINLKTLRNQLPNSAVKQLETLASNAPQQPIVSSAIYWKRTSDRYLAGTFFYSGPMIARYLIQPPRRIGVTVLPPWLVLRLGSRYTKTPFSRSWVTIQWLDFTYFHTCRISGVVVTRPNKPPIFTSPEALPQLKDHGNSIISDWSFVLHLAFGFANSSAAIPVVKAPLGGKKGFDNWNEAYDRCTVSQYWEEDGTGCYIGPVQDEDDQFVVSRLLSHENPFCYIGGNSDTNETSTYAWKAGPVMNKRVNMSMFDLNASILGGPLVYKKYSKYYSFVENFQLSAVYCSCSKVLTDGFPVTGANPWQQKHLPEVFASFSLPTVLPIFTLPQSNTTSLSISRMATKTLPVTKSNLREPTPSLPRQPTPTQTTSIQRNDTVNDELLALSSTPSLSPTSTNSIASRTVTPTLPKTEPPTTAPPSTSPNSVPSIEPLVELTTPTNRIIVEAAIRNQRPRKTPQNSRRVEVRVTNALWNCTEFFLQRPLMLTTASDSVSGLLRNKEIIFPRESFICTEKSHSVFIDLRPAPAFDLRQMEENFTITLRGFSSRCQDSTDPLCSSIIQPISKHVPFNFSQFGAGDVFSASILVQPEGPSFVSAPMKKAGQAVAAASGLLSAMCGNPAIGLQVARTMLVLSLTECDAKSDLPVGFANPTGLKIGSNDISQWAGLCIGNLLIVILFTALHMCVIKLRMEWIGDAGSGKFFSKIAARMYFPSLQLIPILLLLQPTVAGVSTIFFATNAELVQSVCATIAAVAIFLLHLFVWKTLTSRFLAVWQNDEGIDEEQASFAKEQPKRKRQKNNVEKFFLGTGEYRGVGSEGELFLCRYFLAFHKYNPPWFFLAELGLSDVLGILEGFDPGAVEECQLFSVVVLAFFMLHFAIIGYTRPFVALFDLTSASIINMVQVLCAAAAVAVSLSSYDHTSPMVALNQIFGALCFFLFPIKSIGDLVLTCYVRWFQEMWHSWLDEKEALQNAAEKAQRKEHRAVVRAARSQQNQKDQQHHYHQQKISELSNPLLDLPVLKAPKGENSWQTTKTKVERWLIEEDI